jgi:TrmH family RNA methyltransferase
MPLLITSPHNPRVKQAAKLRDHRARKLSQRILIDGARETLRALQAGVRCVELFYCEEQLRLPEARQAVALAQGRGSELLQLTPHVFSKLAYGERTDGVLAVALPPVARWPTLSLPQNPLVVVVEGVEKPGNFGGIVRTADAVGVAAVLAAAAGYDLYNPNAIRASLGTLFSVPLAAASSEEILAWLRQQRLNVFAARVDGTLPYYAADYRQPTAIVLGSEAAGLSTQWSADDIVPVVLPQRGLADSLNVSVTAAVLLYEALRQRLIASDRAD